MNKVKMAIVGAGIWGENHARIYNAHPFAETVALCDMNLDRAKEVAARLNIPQVYSDYNEMFEKSGCDAVAVVTPDFLHADIAVAAAEHKKHILIEKPLATTADDVHRMVKAIRENGVRAMVDLHNRWSPPFNAAHEAIQRGDLGEVYSAYIRLNDIKWVATDMLRWASKSSILWFLGSHSLDTLRHLLCHGLVEQPVIAVDNGRCLVHLSEPKKLVVLDVLRQSGHGQTTCHKKRHQGFSLHIRSPLDCADHNTASQTIL